MEEFYSFYLIFVIITFFTTLFLTIYSFINSRAQGAKHLGLVMLSASVWLLGIMLIFVFKKEYNLVVWGHRFSLVASGFLAYFWVLMIFDYCGHKKILNKGILGLLVIIPFISSILVFLNESSGLLFKLINDSSNPYFNYKPEFGVWYKVHAVYGTVLTLVGIGSGMFFLQTTKLIFKKQTLMLIVPATLMLCSAFPAAFFGTRISYSPFGIMLCCIFFAMAVFRYKFFDIAPIAREKLIDEMTDVMILIDQESRVIDINKRATDIFNKDYHEIIGRPIDRMLENWDYYVKNFTDNKNIDNEISIKENGNKRWFDLKITSIQDRKRIGWLAILHDITSHKKMEYALQKKNIELEELNEELDSFGHTVAHDLKNSIGNILWFGQYLKAEFGQLEEDELQEIFSLVEKSCHKMNHIVDELMLLSGLREGEVQVEILDTGKLIESAKERLKLMIGDKHAIITQPDNWPVAMGYPQWIEEVWVNYLSNAIKYGGKPPKITLGADEDERGFVKFWIKDNGNGIKKKDVINLFKPFKRLGVKEVIGNGLGLSIVSKIIDKMEGKIFVESSGKPGEGSIFGFTLPTEDCELSSFHD